MSTEVGGFWSHMVRQFKNMAAEVTNLRSENEKLRAAIFDGGFDLSPCRVCGKVIVCIPDGVPVCENCAAKE